MDFAIIPFADASEKEIDDKVSAYVIPTVYTSLTGRGQGNLPLNRSYYRFESSTSTIFDSAALDENSVVLKVREWSGKADNGTLYTDIEIEKVEECDYAGRPIRLIKSEKNSVCLGVKAHGLGVYKVTWKK